MKAKWEDAPEWAQWWAKDADGWEWWFSAEPFERYAGWWDVEKTDRSAEACRSKPPISCEPVKEPRPT